MFGEGEGTEGREPEVVPTPPSPLAERLRDFRDGVGDQPDEDKPAGAVRPEGEEAEPTGGEEDTGAEGEEQTEGAEEADEEQPTEGEEEAEGEGDEETEAEGEDAAAPAGRRAPEFAVDIPTLNADGSRGPKGTGVLRLEGLPQEYRDALNSHVKRSLKLDGVLQQLQEARELETVARFYQADPLNAMRLVAVEKPELATQFVESWILQHPKAVKGLIKTLKIDTGDEEKLELQGQLAARAMQDELAAAYDTIDAGTAKQRFRDLAVETVNEITAPLALDDEGVADFEQLAGARVVAEMERRVAARQTPYLTKTELLTLLQPLIQKFTGGPAGTRTKAPAKNGKPAAGDQGLTREQQQQRARTAERFRQVRGGGTGTGVRPKGLKKSKLPPSLGERIKLLRAGKL